jgi:hypothetical protein
MSFDPLLTVLGLLSVASPTDPTTFQPTAYRGGVAIAPAALPTNPTIGTIAIDSGDGNKLKWWSGSWQTAGGGGGTPGGADTQVQFNNSGAFAGSSKFLWLNTNEYLDVNNTKLAAGGAGRFTSTLLASASASGNSSSLQATQALTLDAVWAGGTMTGLSAASNGTITSAGASLDSVRGVSSSTLYSCTLAGGDTVTLNDVSGYKATSTLNNLINGTMIALDLSGLTVNRQFNVALNGALSVSNLYGINIAGDTPSISGSGTITIGDIYGVYIGTLAVGITPTNKRYGIYQADTGAQNRWYGNNVFVPKVLPTGIAGMVVIDSGAGNTLKWYNGSAWVAAGSIGGSIAATQVAYGSGANTIQGSAGFTYDDITLTTKAGVFTDTTLAGSGALDGSALVVNQTWNTTGYPTAFLLNITKIAAGFVLPPYLAKFVLNSSDVFTVNTGGDVYTTGTVMPYGVRAASTLEVNTGGNSSVIIGSTDTSYNASIGSPSALQYDFKVIGSTACSVFYTNPNSVGGIILPHGGGVPSVLSDGMLWTTSTGLYVRINGATVGPLGTGGGSPAGANTQVQYNNGGAFGASAGFTFTSTLLTVNLTGGTAVAGPTGTALQIIKANGNAQYTTLLLDSYMGTGGGHGIFMGRTARGTIGSPSAIQAGDEMLSLEALGYGATAYSSMRGEISIYAAENWTDAAQGTRVGVFTTAPGTIVTTEKFRFWGDGGVSVGTNLSASPGAGVFMVTGTGTYTNLAGLKIQSFDQVNTYIQNNIQNLSNGSDASCDWVATNDTGNDTTNFVDMGINGSGWSSGTWTVNGANDAYVYTSSGNFAIGTASAGKNVVIFSGGTLAANIRASFTDTGIFLTPALSNAGANTGLTFTGAANTAVTLGTEDSDVTFNLTRTVQWATGALATQRAFVVTAPTYAFVGASTLSDAATVAITGAPVQGTNATITRSSALWVQSGVVRIQNAATQDGILLQGRAGGTSNFYTTIIPGTLTASNTLTTPVTGGTITVGTGAANQVAYWSGTNVVTGNAALTFTTTSGALLLANAAGTSTATSAVTSGITQSITYNGIATTDKSSIKGTATFTTANVNTAAAVLAAGIFTANVNMPLTNATVVGTQSLMTATPSGAVGAINFYGALNQAVVASAANVFFASASLVGSQIQATFNTANTTGAAVAAAVVGAKIIPSVVTTNAAGVNTISKVYGAWIAPGTFSSTGGGGLTIADYYGLYIDTLTLTTMTATNRWGVYQSDIAATNFFGGKLSQVWTTTLTTAQIGTTLASTFSNGVGAAVQVAALQATATINGTNAAGADIIGIRGVVSAAPTAGLGSASYYTGVKGVVTANVGTNTYLNNARVYGVYGIATFTSTSTAGAQLLNELTGLYSAPSASVTSASGANSILSVYGINVAPGGFTASGGTALTIGSYYGLYLGAPTLSGTVITNNYGIYQADAAATNSFLGLVITSASTASRAGLRIVHGVAPSAPTDGDFWSTTVGWFARTNGVSQRVSTGLGVPAAEAGDRTLTDADNGKNLICSGSRTFTVNTGLYPGFGCSFKGTVAFTGTATVTDVRTTGATNPWCALCATGTDTYDIVGSKA